MVIRGVGQHRVRGGTAFWCTCNTGKTRRTGQAKGNAHHTDPSTILRVVPANCQTKNTTSVITMLVLLAQAIASPATPMAPTQLSTPRRSIRLAPVRPSRIASSQVPPKLSTWNTATQAITATKRASRRDRMLRPRQCRPPMRAWCSRSSADAANIAVSGAAIPVAYMLCHIRIPVASGSSVTTRASIKVSKSKGSAVRVSHAVDEDREAMNSEAKYLFMVVTSF